MLCLSFNQCKCTKMFTLELQSYRSSDSTSRRNSSRGCETQRTEPSLPKSINTEKNRFVYNEITHEVDASINITCSYHVSLEAFVWVQQTRKTSWKKGHANWALKTVGLQLVENAGEGISGRATHVSNKQWASQQHRRSDLVSTVGLPREHGAGEWWKQRG